MRRLKKDASIHIFIATVFGLGRSPVAPGTVATLVAGIPCAVAVGYLSTPVQLMILGVLFGIGWHFSGEAERQLGKIDPGEIVVDELCGYLAAMVGHPISFASILCGFIFFRLFDIWKPWPICLAEKRLKGGLSIMTDDLLAGIFANLIGAFVLKILNF